MLHTNYTHTGYWWACDVCNTTQGVTIGQDSDLCAECSDVQDNCEHLFLTGYGDSNIYKCDDCHKSLAM